LDTECTGLDWVRKDRVFGISLAWRDNQNKLCSWYGDVRDESTRRWCLDVIPKLGRVTGWYLKYDMHMLRESNIPLAAGAADCSMIRECLLHEDEYDYSLDAVSQRRFGEHKADPWADLATLYDGKPTKEAQATNLHRAPFHVVEAYAKKDAELALRNWEAQETEIRLQGLNLVATMERELLEVIVDMERGGVRVDVARAEEAIPQMTQAVHESQQSLDKLAGHPINVNSQPQVKELLGVHKASDGRWYTKCGVLLEPTESGKSGQLRNANLYQCKNPAAALIAQIRGFIKARDVFLQKYICEMHHKGYVHANFNQTRSEEGDGTYTGRFSVTDPALQQINKRNKAMAAIVRACFIPDPDCEWGCFDWSQKDFRMFAHYLNDPRINEVYVKNPAADFHGITATITGLPRDRDQKTGGANAKQMNLGLIFGMSAGRMAKEMGLPYTRNEKGFYVAGPEAQSLFAKYHDNIPGANRIKESVASVARSRGYIKTQLGRRLRFHNDNAYKAAGILYQSQAAESMKVKTIELHKLVKDRGARLALLVHDEFDLSMQFGRQKILDSNIKELLEDFTGIGKYPLEYRIPILTEYGLGINWYEASL